LHVLPVPRRSITVTARVGLLTSELEKTAFSSPGGINGWAGTRQWLKRLFLSVTFGYSGGAVPEFHRSSLFVDLLQVERNRPPMHQF